MFYTVLCYAESKVKKNFTKPLHEEVFNMDSANYLVKGIKHAGGKPVLIKNTYL
jgi:hypothetical protein